MKFNLTAKKNFEAAKNLTKSVKIIHDNQVYVGIPQEEASRPGEGITNAELLYVQTYGSPANKIPPRPLLEPAIEEGMERLRKKQREALDAALQGNEAKAIDGLRKCGMQAVNEVRAYFTKFPDNGWPPNKPRVIRRKLKKGSTHPIPLIDTGELRKSITYVLITKGGRKK